MEALLFCGIQGSGKTTFYQQFFLNTHVRISLDLLHTRQKEDQFLLTCFATRQRFVVDNTNPTKAVRRRYIDWCKAYQFKVVGYYFHTSVEDAIRRNQQRKSKEYVPETGIKGTYKKLEVPTFVEGFDQLFQITIGPAGFEVEAFPPAGFL